MTTRAGELRLLSRCRQLVVEDLSRLADLEGGEDVPLALCRRRALGGLGGDRVHGGSLGGEHLDRWLAGLCVRADVQLGPHLLTRSCEVTKARAVRKNAPAAPAALARSFSPELLGSSKVGGAFASPTFRVWCLPFGALGLRPRVRAPAAAARERSSSRGETKRVRAPAGGCRRRGGARAGLRSR